ncbi:BglG family transcription antiterminator [Staphylococcus debuckii]|uniref:BglG family transcription antiterminator n=1 Tax=Staphylococcus debuckii TaxID=2044912 RepID=UPI000F431794|nr:transcription antiterminator [Staphylococcus debuckii]AYU55782.1 transcription antiterminator [Staphylococcus debuckii]
MFLSNREKEIVTLLIKYKGQFITTYEIAQQLAVSSRTIHRELKTLEQDLDEFNLSIERIPKKGVQLKGSSADLKQLHSELNQMPALDLTSEEQKAIILYALIQSKLPVKQYSLAHEIGVASTTLTKILDELEEEAADYQLSIERKRGSGISLTGSEAKKREMLSQMMVTNLNSTSVYSVIENHFVYQSLNLSQLSMVELENIFQVERILMDYLGALPYSLTEASYLTLTVHIVLSIERIQHGENVSIDSDIFDSVKDTLEYQVAESLADQLSAIYQVTFNTAEITFITIHLRGAKRRKDEASSTIQADDNHKISQLITFVEDNSQYEFEDKATLASGLKLHLIPAINRLNANIETHNPLTDMIRSKYSRLYDSVERGLAEIWPDLKFPASEIAFVVLHFGGSLKHLKEKALNILVVCSSGIGTSRVLATRLTQTFSEIGETTQASLSDLKQLNLKSYDGIISTIGLEIEEPYITVNPLLPDQDINYVAHYLNTRYSSDYKKTEINSEQVDSESLNQVVSQISDNLEVLKNVQVDDVAISNWQDYLLKQLNKNHSIESKSQFKQVLKDYAEEREIVLDPYPIGLPHMKHALIQSPMILFTRLKKPLSITSSGQTREINYLISMFLPENSPASQVVSAVSETITCNLHRIDDLMHNPKELQDSMKQAFIQETKKILNME